MATDPKRKSLKSETLTIRLDPKTRFMLEFISRLRGQTITTVVERAISDAADQASIVDEGNERTWRSFWHISDGVRALRLAQNQSLYPTYEEEQLLNFAMNHKPFFMIKGFDEWVPDEKYADILWPKINEYLGTWLRTRANDHWAAGKMMRDDIEAAGVKAPVWPPVDPTAKKKEEASSFGRAGPATRPGSSSHLDDDIPF